MSEEEKYKFKNFMYENKEGALGFTIILVVLLTSVLLWVSFESSPPKIRKPVLDLPPPRYGKGPYGQGLYAPPKMLYDDPSLYF